MYRILFLALMFSLIFIKPTNADFVFTKSINNNQFTATTLDFSQLKTANENILQTLFNIDNIIPGGYQVNTLRIKNQGKSQLNYQISFQKKAGNDNFCRSLQIEFWQNGKSFYQGSLVDLNLISSLNSPEDNQDWLVILRLDQNFLSNQIVNCQFDLKILGYNQDINQKSGFEYQSTISNFVSFN